MPPARSWSIAGIDRDWLEHSVRTAVAGTASLLAARLFRLPEAYWAAITTLVIMQSTLGASMKSSGQRLAGTALGAAVGALLATYFRDSVIAFTLGVVLLGLLCGVLRADRVAYRFAGITITIVMLVHYASPAWVVAVHRFVEVSIGIIVGLVITAVWPERSAV